MRRLLFAAVVCLTMLLANTAVLAAGTPSHHDIDPEAHTGLGDVKRSHSSRSMVATANPHATAAGLAMLDKGGSAVDAAIAAQLVLTLVEPQSSGIGGGAFMMHWHDEAASLQLFDGRETAPGTVSETHFIGADQKPMGFLETLIGGYSVGSPGVLRMMAMAHEQHGRLPWKDLFEPAIALSVEGFELSPRLYGLLERFNRLMKHPSSRDYFYLPDGQPKAVGSLLRNADYAASLKLLADKGADAFYTGELQTAIVEAVQGDSLRPGKLAAADIEAYRALEREPLCSDYREYRVCTTPPPSSGATVLQILGILEQLPQPGPAPASIDWIHRFAEASKLSFADRDTYIADPDFVEVPVRGLIGKDYLKRRAQLIDLNKASGKALPGQPSPQARQVEVGSPEFPSTSHLSIVDADGNMVSMTSSVQMAFGSGIMVGGFLLNNQLTDFSFLPRDSDKQLVANRIQPGKRPRSSMSPTIVLKNNKPVLLIGSPGGSRIIDFVARVISYRLDAGMDIAEAIASPNIVHMNRKLELESDRFAPALVESLSKMGHEVVEVQLNSGMQGISIDKNGLTGGADPRREGIAQGQ